MGWRQWMELYRFQACNSRIHHLWVVLRLCHPQAWRRGVPCLSHQSYNRLSSHHSAKGSLLNTQTCPRYPSMETSEGRRWIGVKGEEQGRGPGRSLGSRQGSGARTEGEGTPWPSEPMASREKQAWLSLRWQGRLQDTTGNERQRGTFYNNNRDTTWRRYNIVLTNM